MLTAENREQISELINREISRLNPGLLSQTLTLKEAKTLADLAQKKALEIGVPIAVSIADPHGQQILFHRMENTLPVSAQLATDKAHTAATFRMTTEELGKLAQPGEMLFGVQANIGGRVVIFGGGIPCCRDGAVIGAIGVSGGTAYQDVQIAERALDLFSNKPEPVSEEG
ncbi:ATP:cob(I)alamin adenosyltransferase [Cohaesibacter marisflavi]|uniref:ATP:cob(I)alamin adenosyltransferase n=1 Tax=Cohaesibacter marisflavi TaxID=655353 RepID=A0A1I5FK33_9HYPH|nr:heme-binding protein [Cohaesibacter marisflavi]SFO24127.1 ATP:cob(I)alamin adenosyltransferase [Cohaesibacter marisflavi]